MIRAFAFIALLAGVLSGGNLAHAQNPTLIKPKSMELEDDANRNPALVRKAMVDFARCSLERRRNSVMEYLTTVPGSRNSFDRMRRLTDLDCVGSGSIRYTETLFRGAVYQSLYQEAYRTSGPADLTVLASPDYGTAASSLSGNEVQAIALRRYADCVARDNPKSAHELAMSAHGSTLETDSFASLGSGLSRCLSKGQTLQFSKSILRGVVAEVLYRIRTDAVAVSAPPPKS